MNPLSKLTHKKPKGKYILSLDLGTKMVKAMVSYADYEERTITNLGIGRAEQLAGNIVGGRISNVKGVTSACREAIQAATGMAKVSPEEVVMGFSGNTTKLCTHTFELTREEPGEKMGAAELKTIIRDVHQRSLDKIREGLTYKEKQLGIKLVSSDIVNLSIDGYRIVNPLSFRGKRIRVTVSDSYVLASDFDIINSIAVALKLRLNRIAYGPYAVIKAIGAEDALNFSAVMIDVGGNITDVVVVKNGNIQKASMFILGGHLFTKRLAHKFDLTEKNAEDLKINFTKGRLNEADQAQIQEILAEDIDLWYSGVELVLEDAAEENLIPAKLLFYGGGSQLPGLAATLNRLTKTEIPFSDKLTLGFINSSHISGNVDKTGKLDNFQDITMLALAHLCLDNMDEEDTPNRFLAQII